MAKTSFFKKLSNLVRAKDEDTEIEEADNEVVEVDGDDSPGILDDEEEGQLAVDMYQSPTEIVIKTMVAGVKPEDLDISITRDMVTIRGKRTETYEAAENDFFHKELYWGAFSRTIILPAEIEIEEAEASEKHGLLILRLPKIDKNRQSKLKVRSS
ncbi:MAG: Hsp20/alpha crystallin family protein [bacterium]